MSPGDTTEIFGQLLHGTARAWRQKLDERLKPMGLSQAKWRTLMHLSIAGDALTQAEIAARLGVEEPSLVTLLHRLEREDWITRTIQHWIGDVRWCCWPPRAAGDCPDQFKRQDTSARTIGRHFKP